MSNVNVTLKRSKFGRKPGHRECVEGLGLRKIGDTVTVSSANPCIMGMVNKVNYLLAVNPAESE